MSVGSNDRTRGHIEHCTVISSYFCIFSLLGFYQNIIAARNIATGLVETMNRTIHYCIVIIFGPPLYFTSKKEVLSHFPFSS